MQKGPPVGVNPVYDRYLEGYEGSGLAVSSRGVLELSSNKRIPSTGWLMQSVLPAEEAFAPVANMQRRLLIAAVVLTMMAGGAHLVVAAAPVPAGARGIEPVGADGRWLAAAAAAAGTAQATRSANWQMPSMACWCASWPRRSGLPSTPPTSGCARSSRTCPVSFSSTGCFPTAMAAFPFASEAFADIYGVAPEDGQGKRRRHPRHGPSRGQGAGSSPSLHASAESLELWRIDYRIRRPDGEVKWLLVEAMPEVEKASSPGTASSPTSPTAKATEESLRIAATTFLTLEGIMVTDADGVILRVNPAFTEITGYAGDEVVGRTPAVLKSNRHDAPSTGRCGRTLLAKGVWQGEIVNRRRSGESYPEWLTITAVKDATGVTTHYVGVFQDITARKAGRGGNPQSRLLRSPDPPAQPPPAARSSAAGRGRRQPQRPLRRAAVPRPRQFQDAQRHARPRHRRPAAGRGGAAACRPACAKATRWPAWAATNSSSCSQDLSEDGGEAAAQAEIRCQQDARRAQSPVSAGQPGISRLVEHRRRPVQRPRSGHRRVAEARRPGHVPGEVGGPQHAALLRSRHAGRDQPALRDGGRTASGARRAANSCSTTSRRSIASNRCIGVEALIRWQHPAAGPGGAGRVHPAGRRVRTHPADRPLGRGDRPASAWPPGRRNPLTADLTRRRQCQRQAVPPG